MSAIEHEIKTNTIATLRYVDFEPSMAFHDDLDKDAVVHSKAIEDVEDTFVVHHVLSVFRS